MVQIQELHASSVFYLFYEWTLFPKSPYGPRWLFQPQASCPNASQQRRTKRRRMAHPFFFLKMLKNYAHGSYEFFVTWTTQLQERLGSRVFIPQPYAQVYISNTLLRTTEPLVASADPPISVLCSLPFRPPVDSCCVLVL